jgi:hypothetical protein
LGLLEHVPLGHVPRKPSHSDTSSTHGIPLTQPIRPFQINLLQDLAKEPFYNVVREQLVIELQSVSKIVLFRQIIL